MKKKYDDLKKDIEDEQKAIEEVIERLLKVRNDYSLENKDYSTEPAMGTYLMNFYNGIENIIKRISKVYYQTMPKGGSWHKELLLLSSNPPNGKIGVLNGSIEERLHQYRNFRHRFVSGYGFQLKGEKMIDLIDNLQSLWADIKNSISKFFDNLSVLSD